jgi:hypothetical protein
VKKQRDEEDESRKSEKCSLRARKGKYTYAIVLYFTLNGYTTRARCDMPES